MRLWHTHQWATLDTVFNPPPHFLKSAEGVAPEAVERLIYGFTTTGQRCRKCGLYRVTITPGNTIAHIDQQKATETPC